MSRWLKFFTAVILLAAGFAGGLFVPQNGIRAVLKTWLSVGSTADSVSQESEEHADESGLFDVTIAAQETYGVRVAKAEPGAYTQHITVPAFIRERPTVSNLQASSRLQGLIRRIFVQVGQSVREGDPLVELELTGDELASAQGVLLDSVQQLKILDDEIARLRPAAEDGGIARKNLIAKQYEQRRMKSVIEAKRQELLVRGLSTDDVSSIIEKNQLVRTVLIRVPAGIRPHHVGQPATLRMASDNQFRLVSQADVQATDDWVYSVEAMNVSPGAVVSVGQPVCDLAYHETLLIEGQAYERDLPMLTKIISDQQAVSVSVGDDDSPAVIDNLKILFMDNHVDNDTQTYRFYIEIPNSVVAENIVEDGHRFRTWRFKPGQRGHVRLPQNEWSDRLILPAAAVSEDGVDHVIFQQVAVHDHFHGDEPPHCEFRKIVVKVEYKDRHTVVVDHRGQLKTRHLIAVNNADMLFRAMNSGGHGHEHHGHEH